MPLNAQKYHGKSMLINISRTYFDAVYETMRNSRENPSHFHVMEFTNFSR